MESKRTDKLKQFDPSQIRVVNDSVEIAEELVSDHYKMSASQWLRGRYDVKTLGELSSDEIVHGPFAQIIRYQGQKKDSLLGTSTYDFYKVCLQDHSILEALETMPAIGLFPFCLYIITHELIHIVRFGKFLQNFEATPEEKFLEETRVHEQTHQILKSVNIAGLKEVFDYYFKWLPPQADTWG